MAAPPNTSAATAIDLGTLPFSQTDIVMDDGVDVYTLWYSYTPPTTQTIRLFGWGHSDTPGDVVEPRVWTGTPGDLTAYAPGNVLGGGTAENKTLLFVVQGGTTYYFSFEPDSVGIPMLLDLQCAAFTDGAWSHGSLFINGDDAAMPATIVSSQASHGVLAYLENVALGEGGDILASNGRSLLTDSADSDDVILYDAAFSVLRTITLPFAATGTTIVRAHDPTDAFWVGRADGSDLKFIRVDADGNQGDLLTLTGASNALRGFAVSNDGTILYYQINAFDEAVQRWDLVTNTALPELPNSEGGANTLGRDILVLEDDTILVYYVPSGVSTTRTVKRFSADGTLLNTYPFTYSSSASVTLAKALESPTEFWVRALSVNETGDQVYYRVETETGTILSALSYVGFQFGTYAPAATETPEEWGIINSCTFFVLRSAPSPFRSLRIRRVRVTPTVSQQNNRIFISQFALDAQMGVGNASGEDEDTNPKLMIEQSTDGGFTWGTQRTAELGKIGEYDLVIREYRWNAGRRQTFRVSTSAAVPVVLMDCWITAEPGEH